MLRTEGGRRGVSIQDEPTFNMQTPSQRLHLVNTTERNTDMQQQPQLNDGAGVPAVTAAAPVESVILEFDDRYLRTISGLLRLAHIIFSVISLLFVTTSGSSTVDYIHLPMSSHLRLLVFVSVASFLTSLFYVSLKVTHAINILRIDWNLFDVCTYSILSILFLIGSSLVAAVLHYYGSSDSVSAERVTSWTIQQLIGSAVCGYMSMILSAAVAVQAFRVKLRIASAMPIFKPQRFHLQSQHSTESTATTNPLVI